MRRISQVVAATLAIGFTTMGVPDLLRAQNDAEKMYKSHCVLCHAPDGSGSTPTGKALKAEDLRSDVVQKKTDAELTAAITNGKGKMPAFGKKLKPDDIAKLVVFIRALQKNK
jgi:mono/diheme cytochrome c family protein